MSGTLQPDGLGELLQWCRLNGTPETWPAVGRAAREIGARLLTQVGDDGARWRVLLNLWANFEASWRDNAAKRLAVYARGLTNPGEIEAMRDALRDLLQKHRGFADAQWAMAEEDLEPLDAIFQTLQPIGPEDRHRWLFRANPNFLRPNVSWEDLQAELQANQLAAAEELLAALAPNRLFDFARTITMHHALGLAIAKAGGQRDAEGAHPQDRSAHRRRRGRGSLHGHPFRPGQRARP